MGDDFARSALRQAMGQLRFPVAGAAGLVALFLLIPVLIIFPMAVTADPFLTWPPDLFSFRWLESFFSSPVWTDSLWKSARIAVPVAGLATVLGVLSAFGVAYAPARWRRPLQTLFIAPLVLPLITYALGLYDVTERFNMTGSVWPVIVGQTMLATPLVFIIVSAGLAGRDIELPRAAASLGAPARTVLWRVEIPLVRASIGAGGVVALAYSFDEIVVAFFLSPPGSGTLPVQILASTHESADPTIAAASLLVIAFAATAGALLFTVRAVLGRGERT